MQKTITWMSIFIFTLILSIGLADAKPRKKRHMRVTSYEVSQNYGYGSEGGGRPSGCPHAWCGCWLSMHIFGENRRELWRAFNWLKFPKTSPHVGAIAVMARRGGGHVGQVVGFDDHGNPIIKSGNHNRTVGVATYPKGRIRAYVQPT